MINLAFHFIFALHVEKKRLFPRLCSMTIRLIHVHQLERTSTCVMGSWSGMVWGYWSQRVIFTINAITCLCYKAWTQASYMCINLRPSWSWNLQKMFELSFSFCRRKTNRWNSDIWIFYSKILKVLNFRLLFKKNHNFQVPPCFMTS